MTARPRPAAPRSSSPLPGRHASAALRLLVAILAMIAWAGGTSPAQALSLQLSPAGLPLSPAGPYSTARDRPVGTVIATATTTLTAIDIGALGCTVTALMLSGSPATGSTFHTGLAGLGVNLYYYNGATRIQITPGIQASLAVSLSGPNTVTRIEAELVVTGAVASGSLSSLPSITLTYAAAGLGCGVLNLGVSTITVTASNGTVSSLSCTVTTPSVSVALPRVSAASLDAAGKVAGATAFRIGLNCPGAATSVYVTLTDASNSANRSSNLSLAPSSTAGNVALQLVRPNQSLVFYGPDSALPGTTNQWLVGSSSALTGIPLVARYVATAPASPGSVSASATFTLSYQ